MDTLALIVAISALIISVVGPLAASVINLFDAREARATAAAQAAADRQEKNDKDSEAAKSALYQARLAYLQQTLTTLISAYADASEFEVHKQIAGSSEPRVVVVAPDTQNATVSIPVAAALARARGLIYSIGDQPSREWAQACDSNNPEWAIENINLAISYLGRHIAEIMKTGTLP